MYSSKLFPRPIIVVSACLNSEKVRYDGKIISDDFVRKLKDFADFISVCPETGIGLSTPRPPLRIYQTDTNRYGIFQANSQIDFAKEMEDFSKRFLKNIKEVDGFILKGKSPSCGVSNIKIYRKHTNEVIKKKMGLFAMNVKKMFPDIPMEDELRLKKEKIRHHFLTRVFSFAEFRKLRNNCKSIDQLLEFHQAYKYLLMLYSKEKFNELTSIIDRYKKGYLHQIISDYSKIFYSAFRKRPTFITTLPSKLYPDELLN